MADPVPVRPAATVILARDGADGLEAFMVARHRQIEFASGALVFPGGALEPGDFEIAAAEARRGPGGLDAAELALRVAAVRETFEECGVLLVRAEGEAEWLDGARTAAIAERAEARSFAEMLAAERLALALDALVPFAHWVTPPLLKKQFDTRFYIVAAPADQRARHDGRETVDSMWISPERAIAEAEKGLHTLVPVTRLNLALLGRSADVAGALAAARSRRIVRVEPVAEATEGGYFLRIPREAGYGVDGFALS